MDMVPGPSRLPPAVNGAEHGCTLTAHGTKALSDSASASYQESTELPEHFSNYRCLWVAGLKMALDKPLIRKVKLSRV